MQNIKLIRQQSFYATEGTHKAKIVHAVAALNEEDEPEAKIIFELQQDKPGLYQYMARKTYRLSFQAGDFFDDLQQLIGDRVHEIIDPDGILGLGVIEQVIGVRAIIEIEHRPNPNFPHPFCDVVEIRPLPPSIAIKMPTTQELDWSRNNEDPRRREAA